MIQRVLDAVKTLASDFGAFNPASAVVRSNCARVLATGGSAGRKPMKVQKYTLSY